jgi:hypothetical protein
MIENPVVPIALSYFLSTTAIAFLYGRVIATSNEFSIRTFRALLGASLPFLLEWLAI